MKFEYKKSELRKVGEKIRHQEPLSSQEEEILAAYRLGHRNIVEAFRNHHKQMLVKAKWKDKGILFASRLKKRKTLLNKIASRQQQMDLSRMHDVAGCRLIFLNLRDMLRYRETFVSRLDRTGHYSHLRNDGRYDYIKTPRSTGYRGIHDVYEENTDDAIRAKIEIQYRTISQHAWATALEIWDQTHLKGAKFGLEDSRIQRMFCLYAELLWRTEDAHDRSDRRKMDLSDSDLYHEIRSIERETHVLMFLADLPRATVNMVATNDEILLHRYERTSEDISGAANLLVRQLTWETVGSELFAQELDDSNDLVFVLTKPKQLKHAYNNYFDDASGFVRKVRRGMTLLHSQLRFAVFRHPLDAVFVMPPKKKSNVGS